MYCEIIAAPSGEAPLRIRNAWIGCILPVAALESSGAAGSLSSTVATVRGIVINGRDAFSVLRLRDPAAFSWWRQQFPRVMSERLTFDEASYTLMQGVWVVRQVRGDLTEYDHGPFASESTAWFRYDLLRTEGSKVMGPIEMPPGYELRRPGF